MSKPLLTRSEFVEWSFRRDKLAGLYHPFKKLSSLDQDEVKAYEEEADHYLKGPLDRYPEDIINKLKELGRLPKSYDFNKI